jgi:hypothetical protein
MAKPLSETAPESSFACSQCGNTSESNITALQESGFASPMSKAVDMLRKQALLKTFL